MKKILVAAIVVIGLYLTSASVLADPVVNEITLDPSVPAPLATVTFTANITGEDITGVYINIKECKDDFCYLDSLNESMDLVDDLYQVDVELTKSDVNNIEYWLEIESGGVWYSFADDFVQLYLDVPEDGDNGDDGNGDTTDSDDSPGFELIVFFLGIAILIFILRRKRI
jgi:hypothetical protein